MIRSRWVTFLLILLAGFLSFSSSLNYFSLSAAPTIINFEDLSIGSIVTTQYLSGMGVYFDGGWDVDDFSAKPINLAHSGTKVVETPSQEICSPLRMTFVTLQSRVKVWVGFLGPVSSPITIALSTFDNGGNIAASATGILQPSETLQPINTPLEVMGNANIRSASVTTPGSPPGIDCTLGVIVDDVEFETGPSSVTTTATTTTSSRISTRTSTTLSTSTSTSVSTTIGPCPSASPYQGIMAATTTETTSTTYSNTTTTTTAVTETTITDTTVVPCEAPTSTTSSATTNSTTTQYTILEPTLTIYTSTTNHSIITLPNQSLTATTQADVTCVGCPPPPPPPCDYRLSANPSVIAIPGQTRGVGQTRLRVELISGTCDLVDLSVEGYGSSATQPKTYVCLNSQNPNTASCFWTEIYPPASGYPTFETDVTVELTDGSWLCTESSHDVWVFIKGKPDRPFNPISPSTVPPERTISIQLTFTGVTGCGWNPCLIATATYGSELAPEVQFLREFRDTKILRTLAGKQFMAAFNTWYYSFSPGVAQFIAGHSTARTGMKFVLYPLIGILKISSLTFSAASFHPEFAAVLSGLVASSLIGAFYLGLPLGLLSAKVRRLRGSTRIERLFMRVLVGALLTGFGLLMMGELTVSTPLLIVSTSIIILSTLFLSAAVTLRMIAGILSSARLRTRK